MRTRAALIRAAQTFIAEGKLNVPVLEITQAADVGMGSFYNHFDSKEQLFEAAVIEVLDIHGAMLDRLVEPLEDPAEIFASSFRLTGRLFRQRPDLSRVLINSGLAMISSDRGLAPRALRDIGAANRAGRFSVRGPELAMAVAGDDQPERDDAAATDEVTEELLRMFGVPADEAREICRRPLPDIADLSEPDSAA
jgi:AcrR family transcriptional regulator